MANYRVQITLVTTDGNSANYVTNTWYCAALTDADAGDFATAVVALYNTIRPNLSPLIAQNGHGLKIYNMADLEPRAPIEDTTWNLAVAPSGTPLPPEVAICLSFQGAKISGVPQARRRGRVYLGPLNITGMDLGRPGASIVTTFSGAGNTLLDAGVATAGDWNWAVYSTVNGGTAEVADGWVDNEYDTQRRRGRLSTSRTTFT